MDTAAIDSMIVDYLEQAMELGYNPKQDPDQCLAPEREAVFRLFLWSELIVPGAVLCQLEEIKDVVWRDKLKKLVLVHMGEALIPPEYESAIEARTEELNKYHSDTFDCWIVAEAETIGASAFLSFDHKLRKRLNTIINMPLLTPSEYWEKIAIPRGTQPKWIPAPSNPMSRETWWKW